MLRMDLSVSARNMPRVTSSFSFPLGRAWFFLSSFSFPPCSYFSSSLPQCDNKTTEALMLPHHSSVAFGQRRSLSRFLSPLPFVLLLRRFSLSFLILGITAIPVSFRLACIAPSSLNHLAVAHNLPNMFSSFHMLLRQSTLSSSVAGAAAPAVAATRLRVRDATTLEAAILARTRRSLPAEVHSARSDPEKGLLCRVAVVRVLFTLFVAVDCSQVSLCWLRGAGCVSSPPCSLAFAAATM